MSFIIPTGLIIIWSGTENTIPLGWFICNGSNGTPDLRNKFIVGAGSSFNLSSTGGNADSTVPTHNHTVVSVTTGGSHSHSMGTAVDGTQMFTPGSVSGTGLQGTVTNRGTGKIPAQSSPGSGSHSHTGGSMNPSGVDGTNRNLPPYYSLFFIMKGGS